MIDQEKPKPKIEEGPPIYMESCLSAIDYNMCAHLYKTYRAYNPRTLDMFKPGLFKCRYKMGDYLTTEEIIRINKLIDKLMSDNNL